MVNGRNERSVVMFCATNDPPVATETNLEQGKGRIKIELN